MNAVAGLLLLLVAAPADDGKAPAGTKIDSFQLRDYRGAERSLKDFADRKLVVVAFLGTECPVAKLYAPRLAELAKEYGPKGVAVVGVNANQQDSVSDIDRHAKEHKLDFPILKDVGNVVADRFGAQRTPEVFVLDKDRVVRYRGRIDDQYGVGYVKSKPGRRDLACALDELLDGKPVSTPATEAAGCFIGRVKKEAAKGSVTYTKHIAPLLNKNCLECHRPGQVAPFSLTSYDEVVGWADSVREVVEDNRMPPWHADPKYGKFSNDRRLSDDDKQLIYQWVKDGTPKGDPKDLPPPPQFTEGWRIPKPDAVFAMHKPYKVAAQGTIPYQYFMVDPGFKEDKWVKAAEAKVGNPAVVHHIIVFVQGPNGSDERNSEWLVATAPGAPPLLLPDGMAKRIPAGSKLMFQMHYTANGAEQMDQSRVGLVFADPKEVRKEVLTNGVGNNRFRIPPHDANHRVESQRVFPEDTLLITMMPHMHFRGKSFKYEAVYPDGSREVLLDVPRYDFNWQNFYHLEKPKLLPKGTKLHCTAHFDNSKANPNNPDPDATVTWGDQTWEEMMIGYLDRVVVEHDVQKAPPPAPPRKLPDLDPELEKLARAALSSEEAFEKFGAALRKALPKADRVCVSAMADGKLKVERAAHPGGTKPLLLGAGSAAPARSSALAFYGLRGGLNTNPDLKKARGLDLMSMGLSFGSSAHVAMGVEGWPGSLNVWSEEADAFPKETHDLLRAVAAAVAAGQ